MELFAKDVPPIKVSLDEGDQGINYEAGALKTALTHPAFTAARKAFFKVLNNRYMFDETTDKYQLDKLSWERQVEYEFLNSDEEVTSKIPAVMAANFNGQLDAQTVIGWYTDKPDFFNQCYEAAIQQNPNLAPEETQKEASPDTPEEAAAKN